MQYVSVQSIFPSSGRRSVIVMPNWSPGSYQIRNYAGNLENLFARTLEGAPLGVEKLTKNRWQVEHDINQAFVVSYESWAGELSVSTNWVEKDFALLNPVGLFFYTDLSLSIPQDLRVELPEDWHDASTSLPSMNNPTGSAVAIFQARDFDELADSPILLGNHVSHEFTVEGAIFHLVNQGENRMWDGPKSAEDLAAVVQAHIDFWQVQPFERDYYFINVLNGGSGGLEHDHSSVTTASPWQTRNRGDYIKWLALMSHEFFHAWNVRRMRPEALARYDYENEVYTRELWLAEGLTSYYDNMLLFRSGVIGVEELLLLLAKEIQQYEITSGRNVRSAELASFDAWIKHYAPDANNVNSTTSYYRKGALIGLVMDTEIRRETNGKKSLDDVMIAMYQRYGPGGIIASGYPPGAFEQLVESVSGPRALALANSILATTADPDIDGALEWYGLRLDRTPGLVVLGDGDVEPPAGLGVTWQKDQPRLLINEVIHGGPGAAAGLLPGDEVIAINGYRVDQNNIRNMLSRLENEEVVALTISRQSRVREIQATVGYAVPSDYLITSDGKIGRRQQARLEGWLGKRLFIDR